MRQDVVEETAKGWIACAMEIRGYTQYEIRSVMETACQCQHDMGNISPEDAVNRYRYYRPKRETRMVAAQEAAI